jgi:hypothetical protein
MPRPHLLLLALALAAPGCLGTRSERIHVRRDPEELDEALRRTQTLSPREIDELFAAEHRSREVSPELQRSNDHWRDTREAVQRTIAGLPHDPWRAEELERRRVLVRPWADIGNEKIPTPDPLPEPRGQFADEQDGSAQLPARASEESSGDEAGDEEPSEDEE